MTDLLLVPLADAFMQVGVFVAILVVPFGWARRRWRRQLDEAVVRYRRWGPLVGALLGVTPGCGGAVVLMPLYARGTVSFGTVTGALVATMGDSSFVILASRPGLALQLHGLLFVAGVLTGLAVDSAGIEPRRRTVPLDGEPLPGPVAEPAPAFRTAGPPAPHVDGWILSAGPPVTGLLGSRLAALVRSLSPVLLLFWALVLSGVVVGIPVVFQAVDSAMLAALVGGVDPYVAVGVAGTAVALVVFALNRGRLDAKDGCCGESSDLSDVLARGAGETSFVIVWVAVAYLGWEVLTATTGFDGSQLPLYGLLGVFAGAVVGLVPGCGLQIVFCGLFLAGGMPLSSLVANAVSQDGDALLPLLALERRAALVATAVTTVPAVLTGVIVLAVL